LKKIRFIRGGLGTFGAASIVVVLLAFDPMGCCNGAVVCVENDTAPAVTITDVVVSVNGDARSLGNIGPGSSRKVRLHPRRESNVAVRFVLDGREHSATAGYVEDGPGYRTGLVVRDDGKVLERPCSGPRIFLLGEVDDGT
jgi:hypothetical protein